MTPIIVIAVLAIVTTALVLGVRRSWPRWHAIAEEAVVSPVRAWLAPPQQVPLATLQRRWLKKALHHVTVTVSGKGALPAELIFAVSPADIDRLGEVEHLLADDSATMLRRTADRHDWLVPGNFTVSVEEDAGVVEGRPEARLRRRRPAGPVSSVTTATTTATTTGAVTGGGPRTLQLRSGHTRPVRTALGAPPVADAAPDAGARTELHVPCELISLDGGTDIDLDVLRGSVTIGRNGSCDVGLEADIVSGVHASITCHSGQWILHDRSSLNGTWVNGGRVREAALLHNDEVRFGFEGPRFVFSRLSPGQPAVR